MKGCCSLSLLTDDCIFVFIHLNSSSFCRTARTRKTGRRGRLDRKEKPSKNILAKTACQLSTDGEVGSIKGLYTYLFARTRSNLDKEYRIV